MVDVTGDVACFGISNYAISEGHNLFYENAGSCFSVFIVMIIPEFWRNKESNSLSNRGNLFVLFKTDLFRKDIPDRDC